MNKNITILVFLALMAAAAIFSVYSYSNLEKEKKKKQAALDKLEETLKINENLKLKTDSLTKQITALLSTEDSSGHRTDSKWNTEKTTLIRELKNVNETYTRVNDLSAYQKAYILEKEGFEALVSNNFELALEKISAAEKTSPNFHMCYEISNLLRSNREKLKDEETQRNIKRQIIEKFSWKAPAALLSKLKEQVKLPADKTGTSIKNTVKWPVKKSN